MLERLRETWGLDPDLRLAQLVMNAVNSRRQELGQEAAVCPEVFYMEDDELLEGLARYRVLRDD